ncbi:MAG: PIN domain-containing protein [Acidobacteriaceae bacterium]|jgi:predicted nucleic acid-binding protein
MSRIFWDAMMFIYLLEGHPIFGPQVIGALERSQDRGDVLLTSHLALGEVMAGGKGNIKGAERVRTKIEEMGFSFLPFDGKCVTPFARLRSVMGLKAPDAIHLACAAAAGVDMFLTGDTQLLNRRLHVPGIQFIAHFGMGVL